MKKKNFLKCICLNKSPHVKNLDYSGRYLRQVPQEIFNHERTLETLNLDNNNISELTKELFCCRALKELILSDNELCNLPEAMENLGQLVSLNISKNNLQTLPDSLGMCSQLEFLDASGNAFEELPEALGRLSLLQQLTVNTAFLTCLPQKMGNLVNLNHLEVRENEIKMLPSNIGNLRNLQYLDVGNNELTELPDSLCRLANLTVLCADKNNLASLPDKIGHCHNLQVLEVQNNYLVKFPDSLCNNINLTEILASSNQLQHLPDSLGQLTKLNNLRVDGNQISKLPDSIGKMEALTQLYVSNNELTKLPTNIGFLRKLRDLHADSNNIVELPTEIGSCMSLTVLSLRGNRIQYLPDEIGRIPHLRMINLSNNRVKFLPMSFLKLRELQAVWLNDNQIQPLVQLQSERDVDTGSKCLVCYLLPQMSNTEDPNAVDNDPSAWQVAQESRPRVVQWNDEATTSTGEATPACRSKLPKDAPAKQANAKHILLKPNHQKPVNSTHMNQYPQQQPQPQQQPHQQKQQQFIQQSQQQFNQSNMVPNGNCYPQMNGYWNNNNNGQPGMYIPTGQSQQQAFFSPYPYQHMIPMQSNQFHYPVPTHRLSNMPRTMSGYESDSAAVHRNRQMNAMTMNMQGLDQIRESEPNHSSVTHGQVGRGRLVGGTRQSGYSTDTGLVMPGGVNRRLIHHRSGVNPCGDAAGLAITAPHYRNPYDQLRIMRSLPPSRRCQKSLATSSISTSASNIPGVINTAPMNSLPPPPNRQPPAPPHPPPPPCRPLPEPPFRPTADMIVPPPPTRTPPHLSSHHQQSHPGLASISPSIIDDPQSQLIQQQVHHQPITHQMLVTIFRQASGLGFSITGGFSSNPNPFRPNDKGIFIAKVNACGPADGKLRMGDKIISVNSTSFINAEHSLAVNVLKACGDNVQMLVERLNDMS